MTEAARGPTPGRQRWPARAYRSLRHSLRLRLVALFLLLALATTVAFLGGMQKALGVGWRDAARPLLSDYVDRLAVDIGNPPDVQRAQALVARLPIAVRITGPRVNWQSEARMPEWREPGQGGAPWARARDHDGATREPLLERVTADGHRIEFALSVAAWQNQPRRVGWITLTVLLVLTAFAYLYVRRLLRPLDDIRAGAGRFGQGRFDAPIPVRARDELGVLAQDINSMARDIHQMLEAKRALLLAISHELRSPLTRARLNTELLPEDERTRAQRDALLRDLAAMRDLVTDLLESERLASRHAVLHREPVDLGALVREVAESFGRDLAVAVQVEPGLPVMSLNPGRMRLLVRNLLDNAGRHSAGATRPPEVSLRRNAADEIVLAVRDHGPGVPDEALAHLGEPFWRADASRVRSTGGVGLGLYLCRLVAQAHGAAWAVRNARPGLEVTVSWPAPAATG